MRDENRLALQIGAAVAGGISLGHATWLLILGNTAAGVTAGILGVSAVFTGFYGALKIFKKRTGEPL